MFGSVERGLEPFDSQPEQQGGEAGGDADAQGEQPEQQVFRAVAAHGARSESNCPLDAPAQCRNHAVVVHVPPGAGLGKQLFAV